MLNRVFRASFLAQMTAERIAHISTPAYPPLVEALTPFFQSCIEAEDRALDTDPHRWLESSAPVEWVEAGMATLRAAVEGAHIPADFDQVMADHIWRMQKMKRDARFNAGGSALTQQLDRAAPWE